MSILSQHIIRDHFLAGAVVALLAVPFWGWTASALFFISSILIDLDHWLALVFRTRFNYWNPAELMRFYEFVFNQKHEMELLALDIFHTAEFLLLFGFVAFGFLPFLRPVFLGFIFHLAMDLIHLRRHGILARRCHSIVEYIVRRKKLKREGRDPDFIFVQAAKDLRVCRCKEQHDRDAF